MSRPRNKDADAIRLSTHSLAEVQCKAALLKQQDLTCGRATAGSRGGMHAARGGAAPRGPDIDRPLLLGCGAWRWRIFVSQLQ